jgi:hypothetical protein
MADTTNQDFLQSIINNAIKQGWRVNETTTLDVQGGFQTNTSQQNIYLYPPTDCCIKVSKVNGYDYPHIHIYYKLDSQDINYVLSYVDGEKVVHGTGKWDRGVITINNYTADQTATNRYIGDFLNLCKSCDIRAPMPRPMTMPKPSDIIDGGIKKNNPVSKTTTFKPRAVQLGKSANAPILVKSIIKAGKSTRRRRSKTRSIKQKKRKSRKNQSRRRKTTRK